MYLMMLFLMAVVVAFADFMFLTNFKASVLIAIGTAIVVFMNYRFSISAIGETRNDYRQKIFSYWRWYHDEFDMAIKSTGWAISLTVAILFFWYLPKGYTINWRGVILAITIVPIASIIAGILGTKRGLQKHTV